MNITIDMPLVDACNAKECGYNSNNQCHARAITIGDGTHPGCDTSFLGSPIHTNGKNIAGVGACKVIGCKHNDDLECMAESITVNMRKSSLECVTYQAM